MSIRLISYKIPVNWRNRILNLLMFWRYLSRNGVWPVSHTELWTSSIDSGVYSITNKNLLDHGHPTAYTYLRVDANPSIPTKNSSSAPGDGPTSRETCQSSTTTYRQDKRRGSQKERRISYPLPRQHLAGQQGLATAPSSPPDTHATLRLSTWGGTHHCKILWLLRVTQGYPD